MFKIKESAYEFRKELNEIHKPKRRDYTASPIDDEIEIDEKWSISIPEGAGIVLEHAAVDLQDYLRVSMNISLRLMRGAKCNNCIRLNVAPRKGAPPRSYRFKVTSHSVDITGATEEGTSQGCYFIEDLMNLRAAPFLKKCNVNRKPYFSPRMIHSGWGLDQFPDSQLSLIAHSGFDSILLFVKGPNETTHGYMDFNELIDRCAKFGLGVYFYSYLPSFKHPDEADAEEFFDKSYGQVFRACPKAKGIILVGESCGFPSKDERTTGRMRVGDYAKVKQTVTTEASFEASLDYRPSPGFFPCRDYPQWLDAVKKAIRKYAPCADIVFWTYNWGNAPEEQRLELVNSLPLDCTLLATFEMFEIIRKYPNHQTVQPDYSITFPGPGSYFKSEAEAAGKRGLRLYTMSNTAGRTWDFGVVPYIPVPQQWLRRFLAMRKAHDKWSLSGVMDSHHYGWYPSEISEYAKWCFWSPDVDYGEILAQIARRDFGNEAAPMIVRGWELWSKAIDSYTPGFDDQAGPLRVGPSYPFLFKPCLYPYAEYGTTYPVTPQSPVGARWIHIDYHPEHVANMTNCGRRIREDIRIIETALKIWETGNAIMEDALAKVPMHKRAHAEKAIGLGIFCGCAIHTMLNTKKWWLLNRQLEIEPNFTKANAILDKLLEIVNDETDNVKRAIPLAEADSRLGWEPSMDYVGGVWHLQWKLHQLSVLKDRTLPAYRKTLSAKNN